MPNQNRNSSSGRGFAGMDDDKQREIASKGGKASHAGDADNNSRGGGSNRDR